MESNSARTDFNGIAVDAGWTGYFYHDITAAFNLVFSETDIYGIHSKGVAGKVPTVLAFFSSEKLRGLALTADWFGAKGMPPEQIAQNLVDNMSLAISRMAPAA